MRLRIARRYQPFLERWAGETGLSPDWGRVTDQCREASGFELAGLPVALRQLLAQLRDLSRLAAGAGISPDILERQRLSIRAVLESLAAV